MTDDMQAGTVRDDVSVDPSVWDAVRAEPSLARRGALLGMTAEESLSAGDLGLL